MNAKRNMRISFAVSPAQDYTAGMGTLHSDCVFCERILQRRSEAVWDQPLAQTDDYLVVPTKGAIVPGWLMVVSKEHLLCAGALPSDALTGLRRALQITKRLVEPNFGPATLFEHGPTTRGTALGCGVDHLHIHVASLPFSLRTSFRSLYRDSTWTAVTDWTDLSVVHKRGTPYIAIQGPSEELSWCRAPANTRQPLRRAVASAVGLNDQFDYSLYPYIQNVSRTVELLT